MKFTIVFTTLLCISTSWAVLAKKVVDDPKDKREAPVGYGSPGLSAHSYQTPSLGQGDASAISVGAGYSIGGAKPSYSFGGQGSSGALQYSAEGLSQLSPNSHGSIQLAPITLQPHQGSFSSGDLSQFMSQLSHSLGSGGLSLQPSTTVAEFHQGAEGGQALQGGQEYVNAYPQFAYTVPKQQQQQQYVLPEQFQQQLSNAAVYTSGSKGLGSYGTGPVLFTPSSEHSSAPSANYGSPNAGHSLGDAGSLTLGGSGHSLTGLSIGGAGHSYSGGSYKPLNGGYTAPSKSSFKPSAYLGSSVQGDSGLGVSSLSGSYGAPSFGGYRGSNHGTLSLGGGGHGFGGSLGGLGGFGGSSSKFIAPVYTSVKGEGLEGASAFSAGHVASPPGTTYGFPASSFSNNAHAASSNRPYYTKHHHHASPSGFGEGSSAYRAPVSGHSSLSSYSSIPKYSFGSSSSHYAPKDAHGSASETTYNTIKYSEELKPRGH